MVCVRSKILEFIRRYEKDIGSFIAVIESCSEQLDEIHLNIALETLMNTFMDSMRAQRDRKYLKKLLRSNGTGSRNAQQLVL